MQMVDRQQTGEDSSASYFKAEGGSGYVAASNSTAFDGLNKQTNPSVQASGTVSLEYHAPAPTDVTSQWKMILHEESNQYYYWNTLTGETSWEVPAVLTQTATAYGTGYNDSGHMVTDAYNLISGVEPTYLQQPMENMYTGTDGSTSLTAELGERSKSEDRYAKSLGNDGHQVECQIDTAVNYQPCHEELTGPGVSDHVQATVDQGATTDLPSRLLSQTEGLLEKLRSLKKSHGNFHSNEQISKFILELEVRHSDVKALLNDTSPLVSFWLHTEKELKRLEDAVNDEIYELAKSAVMDGIAETDKSSPKEKLVTDETQDSVEEGELAQSGKTLHSDESADASGGDGSPTYSQSNPAEQSDNVTTLDEIQKVGSSVVEDVDMDVDMEVEEPVPVPPSDSKMFSQTEPSNLHADVPPPPGEEWVPPPPSEIEDVPPPPPDSFSEPVPPPPPLENDHVPPPPLSSDSVGVPYTVPQSYIQQPTDYAAQYNLSYPESSYQYITNAVAPNTQFYGHVDGSQVSLPQSAYYYETVPGTSEVAPVEAYYNLNSVAPLFPVSAETTLNHGGVGSINYNIPSDSSKAVEPSSKSNDSAETASLSSATQSTDGTGGASVLAKGQSKVKRPKKRTVVATTSTLRSNKKVSSLVDKWKAAKEELNDSEEEEEEDNYGILDRKRRREIEEWKSRQIASGEAKDNANFQPLGGDWREKVKRRKERGRREGDDEPKKKEDEQQKPDLTKLSAHLPSGWQAYWDESTKKTYYGNTVTSETSWTRPTSNT
ncbi:uncharacterized protein LOC108811825 isoform X2 [Raphanus sativus]|nr:uncharacterized protein LOC108811825 isoform X2 [Raphanus sativus]XP_018439427.1 PREDICTED: pinin isoform X2 [Raphanus sativus]XP_056845595.1 uncharacterized protein LOC130496924 isoform X2 [Raphanus sativus]XP_056845596.1 uncharacterized protein LOC130496924 isoform X2 [Raphanus sativus]XP_056845597.1 uncharacterized protein LOC130496924 isoform X2 [Raphanus sativus]XP_056845598.1 uncharacterized protein LOC130496924 isoform X2 [Raphanus sativus]XP_056856403.1 uncharacterized protein LOC1